jgi:membrane protease YdiL (CAAX protease family)
MKKCTYCGKEYADEVSHCPIDGELLPGSQGESPIVIAVPAILPFIETEIGSKPISAIWTERQLLIIEVVLFCLVAFSGSVLSSFHVLGNQGSNGPRGSAYTWTYALVRQGTVLGLLWYLLIRRGKNFSDLGLRWAPKDIGWSILLNIGGGIAHYTVYWTVYHSGLTAIADRAAKAHVESMLFGGGIFYTTILFQFLNPFFEELVVRAYLMTQVRQLTNSAVKAVLISTALQTSYHFYQGVPLALAHGATFLLWSVYYAKTNRISPVILAHLYNDVSATLFYMARQ